MNFVNLFLLVSISQGFIFGFAILFSPFYRSKVNAYLGYAILTLTYLMLNVYLDAIGVFIEYPKLAVLYDIEWIFLFPIFFFCYILKSIDHPLAIRKKRYWLYLPFLLSAILNVVYNLECVYQWFAFSWDYKNHAYDWLFDIQDLGYYSFNFILAIWSYQILRDKKFSEYRNVKWLKRLCIWVFSLVTSWILIDVIDMLYDIGYVIRISIICSGVSCFIFWVVYYGIYTLKLTNNPKAVIYDQKYSPISNNRTTNVENSNSQRLTQSSSFTADNSYFQKLENLLQKDQIYRDPDLNQDIVAELLQISTGYLSQIVNEVTKKNFSTYINAYRIKEVKAMILDVNFDKYSLYAIGLEAGFKSKTTFYTSFKKETGYTPHQYKTENKKVRNY
ncbi:AraC family transcriptional regulator [Aquimarina sp. U1-2]|uniref:helix-turn-helix domain-containing protein n=1 Tax=Aquimarina sp. U1-2 TaxID=2823141 RepID=UPI001AECDAC6|nr:helix-turn-helix domain-containing protein [Aquimarina sp. U1-2]MBP2831356.1 AraC family transcriptional regulator [Aquimarina sp. U1-2]